MSTQTHTNVINEYASRFTVEPIVATKRITDGSINETFEITTSNQKFILQRMNPIFPTAVMDNLHAVAAHLKAAGVLIPDGLRTLDGETHVVEPSGVWYRALSYVPGVTIHNNISVKSAESAGRLVGAFHAALADCEAPLAIAVKHFQDTHYYLARMERIADACTDERKVAVLKPIVSEIVEISKTLNTDIRTLPQRIIHADLKVSNIRFNENGEAVGLIDMDTMMHGSVVTEMGDALRSWCGTAGEDSPEQIFDEHICKAALAGYMETATGITQVERDAIPEGIRILTLTLAARFITDAFEETYFAKSSQYPSLYEQNKTRAENQLQFLKAFEAKRDVLK